MVSLSSSEARDRFADTLNRVAYGAEKVAIERPGKDPVYLISKQDYELFQALLQQAEDRADLQVAEARMADNTGKTVGFEEFFAGLER